MKHCIGSKKTNQIEIPCYNGLTEPPNINSDDLNVNIPFFVIHGNHDAPAGENVPAPCKLLSTVKFINYFKTENIDDYINLSPVVIRRNDLDVVLYGIGFLFQKAFYNALKNKKFNFLKPNIQLNQNVYIICLIHQDKIGRDSKMENFQEMMTSTYSFIDLFIWGHEHEHIKYQDGSKVMQIGSTICTNLSKKSSFGNYMVIYEISLNNDEIHTNFTEIPLQKTRPLLYKNISIPLSLSMKKEDYISKIETEIQNLLAKSEFEKPFVRLRIQKGPGLWDPHCINVHNIEHNFSNIVANPTSIIKTKEPKIKPEKDKKKSHESNSLNSVDPIEFNDVIFNHLSEQQYDIIEPRNFMNSITSFMMGNTDAIKKDIENLLNKKVELFIQTQNEFYPKPDKIDDEMWNQIYEKTQNRENVHSDNNFNFLDQTDPIRDDNQDLKTPKRRQPIHHNEFIFNDVIAPYEEENQNGNLKFQCKSPQKRCTMLNKVRKSKKHLRKLEITHFFK